MSDPIFRIGELSERVSVERKTRTTDAGGGYAETWAVQTTVWALVRPMSGNERANAQQVASGANYLVVVRAGLNVTAADRLIWLAYPDDPLNVRFVKRTGARSLYLAIEAEMGVQA